MHVANKLFFLFRPLALLDVGPEVVLPSIATLLSGSTALEFHCNLSPMILLLIIE
jgi:hypothetical protein